MNLTDFKLKSKWLKKFFKDISKKHIGEHSAQCAYYTILSFIPFAILLMSLIKYTGLEPQAIYDAVSNLVPENMQELILGIIQEVYSKSIGTISISIIFILWSAGKGFFALTKALQAIYNTHSEPKASYIYLRVKAIIETIVFIILIVVALVVSVFGSTFVNIMQEYFGSFENFNIISSIFSYLMLTFVVMLAYLLLYKFVPKHKVTFKSQIYGAVFGAVLLNIVSFVFSIYLDIFKGFSVTYGSLTTLMLIMMWVFACFYTIFLGATLNSLIAKRKAQKITNKI